MNSFQNITDQSLLQSLEKAILNEKKMLAEVIRHLAEVYQRRLYAKEGYSSLFAYLQQKYHYSESAAYRRIQAAKLSSKFPEILSMLETGKINLINLCLIQPYLTLDNAKALLAEITHKTKREVEDTVSVHFLDSSLERKPQDKIRRLPLKKVLFEKTAQIYTSTGGGIKIGKNENPLEVAQKESQTSLKMSGSLSDTEISTSHAIQNQPSSSAPRKVKIEFVADENVANLIERAKEVLRRKYPNGRLEDLVREAFELLLEKKDPLKKAQRKNKAQAEKVDSKKQDTPRISSATKIKTRYIPTPIKQAVWKRDKGQCSFCQEKAYLEIDHIHPRALGGKTEINNLRLLCSTHNKLRAQETFSRVPF